jgi:hypothetical protein
MPEIKRLRQLKDLRDELKSTMKLQRDLKQFISKAHRLELPLRLSERRKEQLEFYQIELDSSLNVCIENIADQINQLKQEKK